MEVAVTRFAVEPPSVRRCYRLEELLSFLFLDFVLLTSLIHFSFIRTSTVWLPWIFTACFHSASIFHHPENSPGPRIVVWRFVVESQPFEQVPREHIAYV
jgi:hypothetical protein